MAGVIIKLLLALLAIATAVEATSPSSAPYNPVSDIGFQYTVASRALDASPACISAIGKTLCVNTGDASLTAILFDSTVAKGVNPWSSIDQGDYPGLRPCTASHCGVNRNLGIFAAADPGVFEGATTDLLARVWDFSPTVPTVSTSIGFPTPRHSVQCACSSGKFYITRSETNTGGYLDVYDFAGESWSTLSSEGGRISPGPTVVLENGLVVFGPAMQMQLRAGSGTYTFAVLNPSAGGLYPVPANGYHGTVSGASVCGGATAEKNRYGAFYLINNGTEGKIVVWDGLATNPDEESWGPLGKLVTEYSVPFGSNADEYVVSAGYADYCIFSPSSAPGVEVSSLFIKPHLTTVNVTRLNSTSYPVSPFIKQIEIGGDQTNAPTIYNMGNERLGAGGGNGGPVATPALFLGGAYSLDLVQSIRLTLAIGPDICNGTFCYNGGTCTGGGNCTCAPGYTNRTCKADINECQTSQPCENNSTCTNLPGTYKCDCLVGYEGFDCEINPNNCVGVYCGSGACIDGLNSSRCECYSGWTGKNCTTDIKECASTPCHGGGTCVEDNDRFDCVCPPERAGTYCQINLQACASTPCQNGATCLDLPGFLYNCTCAKGYNGTQCQGNINECVNNTCFSGSRCMDLVNGYVCDVNRTVLLAQPEPDSIKIGGPPNNSTDLFGGHSIVGYAMVYDSINRTNASAVYICGGYDLTAAEYINTCFKATTKELLAFGGTPKFPVHSKNNSWPSRSDHSMVYTPRGKYLLVGGWRTSPNWMFFKDVWTSTDLVTWTELGLAPNPPPWTGRRNFAMAVVGDDIYLYGGTSGISCSNEFQCGLAGQYDLWRSRDDGATWQSRPNPTGWRMSVSGVSAYHVPSLTWVVFGGNDYPADSAARDCFRVYSTSNASNSASYTRVATNTLYGSPSFGGSASSKQCSGGFHVQVAANGYTPVTAEFLGDDLIMMFPDAVSGRANLWSSSDMGATWEVQQLQTVTGTGPIVSPIAHIVLPVRDLPPPSNNTEVAAAAAAKELTGEVLDGEGGNITLKMFFLYTTNNNGTGYSTQFKALGQTCPPCGRSRFCSGTLNSTGGMFCDQCTPGYAGATCSKISPCGSSPCLNGGTCTWNHSDEEDAHYECSCPDGATGANCETDINECTSNPCVSHRSHCVDHLNFFTCEYNAGSRSSSNSALVVSFLLLSLSLLTYALYH